MTHSTHEKRNVAICTRFADSWKIWIWVKYDATSKRGLKSIEIQ